MAKIIKQNVTTTLHCDKGIATTKMIKGLAQSLLNVKIKHYQTFDDNSIFIKFTHDIEIDLKKYD